eukprot:14890523-Ditylum_brightwellii.AAC.1
MERFGEKQCPTSRSNPNTPNGSFAADLLSGRVDVSIQSMHDSVSSKQTERPRVTKPIPFNLSEPRSAASTP